MRVLVACEESQRVCIEFRKLGHEAYSCDIKPCSGGHPEWHIQGDCIEILKDNWDLVIAHPPCTYLTVTANKYYNVNVYGEKAIKRAEHREEAVKFFMEFTNMKCKWAIENPVGVMSTRYRKPDQFINPYMFGDPYEKRTCLWLNGLPLLKPTNIVKPEPRKYFASGKSMPAWYDKIKGNRSEYRSKTFLGIAKAFAEQWGTIYD